jgi:hypothetical protein
VVAMPRRRVRDESADRGNVDAVPPLRRPPRSEVPPMPQRAAYHVHSLDELTKIAMGSLGRLPFDALGHHVLSCLGLRELLPVMTTCTGLIAVAQRWTCDRLTEEQIRADELIAVTDLRFVDDETTAPIVPAKVKRPFDMHALVAYLALFSWEARQFGEVLCGAVRQRRTRDAADVLPRVTVLYSSGEAAGLLFDRALQAKSLAGADVDNTRVATVSTMTSRHDDGRASMLLATPTAMAFLRLAHGHYRFDGCTRPQLAFRPRDLFSVRLKAVSYPSAGAEDVPSVRMDDVSFVVLRDVPGRFGGGWVIGSEATPTGLASSRLVSAVSHLNAAANAVASGGVVAMTDASGQLSLRSSFSLVVFNVAGLFALVEDAAGYEEAACALHVALDVLCQQCEHVHVAVADMTETGRRFAFRLLSERDWSNQKAVPARRPTFVVLHVKAPSRSEFWCMPMHIYMQQRPLWDSVALLPSNADGVSALPTGHLPLELKPFFRGIRTLIVATDANNAYRQRQADFLRGLAPVVIVLFKESRALFQRLGGSP